MTTIIIIASLLYVATIAVAMSRYWQSPRYGKDALWSAGHYVTWLLWSASPRGIEWFSGSMLWLWGLWIAAFDAFNLAAIYAGLAGQGSSAQWGGVFVVIGITHGLSRLFAWPRWLRNGSMLFVTASWTVIGVALTYANWRLTSTIMYNGMALASWWAYLRLALPVVHGEGMHANDHR
jgi:hypothetical protein